MAVQSARREVLQSTYSSKIVCVLMTMLDYSSTREATRKVIIQFLYNASLEDVGAELLNNNELCDILYILLQEKGMKEELISMILSLYYSLVRYKTFSNSDEEAVRFFTELCAVYSGKVTLLTDNYKNIIEADCEGQRKSKVNTFLLSTLYKILDPDCCALGIEKYSIEHLR
ncbi:uncharacterized protein LOC135121377 [Zophobas morio]|uniref:uncharacterized protein LOC135121377 n=1 Tax=Zophobas morio TaxID=2755281 RepID=UPI00308330AD